RLSTLREIHRAATAGRLSPDCATASFVPGSLREGRVDIKLSLGASRLGWHGQNTPSNTPWRQMTELEVRARRQVQELADFMRQELPAFHKARLGRMFTQVGPRTGRRAQGRATLSETDVLDCRKSEDGVAWGTWPVEVWEQEASPRLTRLPEGEYYEIPLGCLQAADCECVWMAGRCLSAAPHALASARVIGTAMSTGWAAGAAAAHQASGRPLADAIVFLRGRSRETESQAGMEQTD
ncbi:MAG: FAD-dependent oxidoreductase, partial [Phycisphaerae bacterium]